MPKAVVLYDKNYLRFIYLPSHVCWLGRVEQAYLLPKTFQSHLCDYNNKHLLNFELHFVCLNFYALAKIRAQVTL